MSARSNTQSGAVVLPAVREWSFDPSLIEELRSAPDKKLLKRMRSGDAVAFEELFRRYETRMVCYATRYIGSADLARDVCQEVFLKLISKPPRVLLCNSLASWLFRVARNLAVDKRRRRKFEVREGDVQGAEPMAEGDPLQALTLRDDCAVVKELVETLPEDLRDVVELRTYGRVSFKDISSILKIPQGTALWRMHRALQILRQKWRRYEEQV